MRKQSIYAVAVASMLAAGAAMGRHSNSEKIDTHNTARTLQLLYASDSHIAHKGSSAYTKSDNSANYPSAQGTRPVGQSRKGISPMSPQATSTWWVRNATGHWVRTSTTISLAGLRIPAVPHPAPPPTTIKSPPPQGSDVSQPAHTQPEVAQSAPAPAQSAPPPAPPAQPAGGVWAELRQCESGGNYGDNTGNGYYGAYQFSLSTWYSLGETGLPSNAPPAVQDAAAQRLQATAGWGQWPVCSQQLGL